MDAAKVLTHKNRLRSALKELSLLELEKLQDNITEYIEQARAVLEQEKAEQEQKLKEIEAIKQMMAEKGLSFADFGLDQDKPAAAKTSKPVAAKYRVTDAMGTVHEWSGRGRTPKAFQDYFDKGFSKESCLIK